VGQNRPFAHSGRFCGHKITKETVKTIVQGMPVDAVYLWLLTRVLFLLHTRPRVQRASGIPCALCCFEGGSLPTTRASRAARTRTCVGVLFAAHPSRRPPAAGSSR